jgi:hypothetical protein
MPFFWNMFLFALHVNSSLNFSSQTLISKSLKPIFYALLFQENLFFKILNYPDLYFLPYFYSNDIIRNYEIFHILPFFEFLNATYYEN